MSQMLRLGSVFGLVGLVAGIAATEASAAGFQLREQSAAGLGNSFAGSAANAEDASTIFYNPAGMTLLKGNQFSGNASLIMPQSRFKGNGLFAGTSSGDAVSDAMIGSTFAFWDYASDLKFGVGVTAPFGLRTGYPIGWAGRYFALESSLTNINVNPSVAYRVNSNLSIGAGVQIAYTEAVLSSQVSPLGPFAEIKGDNIGVGFNVGAMWEFSPQTRIGLSYRSAIENQLDGKLTVMTPGHAIIGAPTPVTAGFNTPAMASLGLSHQIDPKWTVKASIDWTGWSSFKNLIVRTKTGGVVVAYTPEHWDDSWFFSLGADYLVAAGHKLRFGVAYDISPVKDAYRTARIPDSDRFWLSTGYSMDVSKNIRFDLSYAHLFAKEVSLNETKIGVPVALTGKYSGSVDIVSTGFVYKF